eukprot:3574898-Amphidinium_carterae.1
MSFVEENGEALAENLGRLAIASSRLYVGSMTGLELVAMMSHRDEWAAKVPATESEHPALAAWQARPKDNKKCLEALKVLFQEKQQKMAQWSGKGNSAEDVFGSEWRTTVAKTDEGA